MSNEFTSDYMGSENEQMQNEMAMDATNGDGSGDHAGNGSGRGSEDEDDRKLFIGGLAHGTTVDNIKAHFSTYGEISKVDLKYDMETKKSRGFGFITFVTTEALNAVLKAGSHTINGKTIDPKRAIARPKPPPQKKVFVGGVSSDISEDAIREHFLHYGAIEKVELPIDKESNKRRQFCFVVFETEDAARNAVKSNKQMISNMTKECDVKLATPPPPKDGARGPYQGGRFGGSPGSGPSGRGGARGGGRGGFQGQQFGSQYGGYGQGGYSGGQGYQGYDYSGGYSGGYGNGYDNNYWSYGQGGYNQQQGSGYGKVKRGAGSQGYHPYGQ